MAEKRIPFVDLRRQYESIRAEMDHAISKSLNSFQFKGGPPIAVFEQNFADCLGLQHCIAVGNGTDALYLSLKALNIKEGDEVITPAFSWISSAEVITQCGGRPVFADVDDEHFTIDPEDILRRITPKTKAIVIVHLFGNAADLTSIVQICKDHNLYLVEDCAQAHLTRFKDKVVGSFGHMAAFSFYPTKNLGAYGDAGCVVTSDPARALFVRRFANHGALEKDDHEIEGMNSRMDTMQAEILTVKLQHLPQWNTRRAQIAQTYRGMLQDLNGEQLSLPAPRQDTVHSWHQFVIKCQNRDQLKAHLAAEGIDTIIHYPRALHNLPAYRHLNLKSSEYPVANDLQQKVLSLPIFPELTDNELGYIRDRILKFYTRK